MYRISSLFLAIFIIFIFRLNVFANDKEYNVPNAEFNVYLQENGDAIVQEIWTVNYTKGSFTRFYKDFYKDVTPVEKFDDIKVLNCLINGEYATEVNDTNIRNDYTYCFEHSKKVCIPPLQQLL